MIPILFNISILLDVQAYLQETSPFFVCPNGFGGHFFTNVYITWDVYLTLGPAYKNIRTHVFNFFVGPLLYRFTKSESPF